jgi:hypothetical protein
MLPSPANPAAAPPAPAPSRPCALAVLNLAKARELRRVDPKRLAAVLTSSLNSCIYELDGKHKRAHEGAAEAAGDGAQVLADFLSIQEEEKNANKRARFVSCALQPTFGKTCQLGVEHFML